MVGYEFKVKRYNILYLEDSLNALSRLGWDIIKILDAGTDILGDEIIVIAKRWKEAIKKTKPLDSLERELVIETLEHNKNNYTQSAKDLGISKMTFYRRMEKFGLIRRPIEQKDNHGGNRSLRNNGEE